MDPLSITALRQKSYPGSDLTIERELDKSENYRKFIASYFSEGKKQFMLLTIPDSPMPDDGFPLLVFCRGYVDPKEYQIDRQYLRYLDYFAREGFVVIKPDFSGMGESEGELASVTLDTNVTDVLNAVASILTYGFQISNFKIQIDQTKLGILGHSMGAMITMQAVLARPIFSAAVLLAGFIIEYSEIIKRWLASDSVHQKERVAELLERLGTVEDYPHLWADISPINFVSDLTCQVQLHYGQLDKVIPISDATHLNQRLEQFGKSGGLFVYQDGGHNLNEPGVLDLVMSRSVEFVKDRFKL